MFGTAFKIVRKIELFAEFGVMVVNASFAHIHSPSVLYHYCMCSAQFYSPVQAFEEEFILRIMFENQTGRAPQQAHVRFWVPVLSCGSFSAFYVFS